MSSSVQDAVVASRVRCDAGDLISALELLEPHRGDTEADLQAAAVLTTSVFFEGTDPAEVDAAVTDHGDHPRSLDLKGLARYYAEMTHGSRELSPALSLCLLASRGDFQSPCWRADNRFHLGLIQQAMGSHDLAVMYLEEAATVDGCPHTRAFATRHLGMDAELRGDRDGARLLLAESLALRRRHGIDLYLPFSLIACAELSDDPEAAQAMLGEAVTVARSLGLTRPLALSLCHRARATGDHEVLAEARALAERIGHEHLIGAIDELRV